MKEASFKNAKMNEVDFSDADLSDVDFRGADFWFDKKGLKGLIQSKTNFNQHILIELTEQWGGQY